MNSNDNPSIFIVEDDPIYQAIIKNELEEGKYTDVEVLSSGEECLANLHKSPSIVLLDYHLNESMNGLKVLKKIKESSPKTQVVVLSAQEKMEIAVAAIKYGAYDYVVKTDTAMKRVSFLINKINKWNTVIKENKEIKTMTTIVYISLGILLVAATMVNVFFPQYFD